MTFVARFFLLVVFLSMAELYLLVELSARTSVLLTFALCAFTGIVGGALVRHQGLRTLAEIGRLLGEGKMPGEQIVSGLILLSIGIMLLTPGFITDSVAFLMLVPQLRYVTARVLAAYFKKRIDVRNPTFSAMANQAKESTQPPGSSDEPLGSDDSFDTAQARRNRDIIIEVDAED